MTKAAHLYDSQEMTQPEIAAQLDLSQATVSRLLKRAKQEQIVRVTVNVPHGIYSASAKGFRAFLTARHLEPNLSAT